MNGLRRHMADMVHKLVVGYVYLNNYPFELKSGGCENNPNNSTLFYSADHVQRLEAVIKCRGGFTKNPADHVSDKDRSKMCIWRDCVC